MPKRLREGFYDNDDSTLESPVEKFKELDSEAYRIAGIIDAGESTEIYLTYDNSKKDNTPALGQYDPADAPADSPSIKTQNPRCECHALRVDGGASEP